MQKSLLNIYLQKVAQGDQSALENLCKRLAERLLIVPTVKGRSGEKGDLEVKVSVVRLQEAHRTVVPVFTSERTFSDWCVSEKQQCDSISLLGADMCMALGVSSWIVIDPGAAHSAELQPFVVEKIGKANTHDSDVLRFSAHKKGVEAPYEGGSEPAVHANALEADEGSGKKPEVEEAPKKKRSFLGFLRRGK